jgi:hypothetical protein
MTTAEHLSPEPIAQIRQRATDLVPEGVHR